MGAAAEFRLPKMDSDGPGNDLDRSALEASEWRRFWKVALFSTILPTLAILVLFEALGQSTGETDTPAQLVRALHAQPGLVWAGLHVQSLAELKLAQVAEQKPDVLIIGHSRMGQFEDRMFRPYSFYNLSRVSWPFDTYTEMLRHFPAGYRPKVIIFCVDFSMFDPQYMPDFRVGAVFAPVYGHQISKNLIALSALPIKAFLAPRLIWRRVDFTGAPARGINAILGVDPFLDGFRKDGSLKPAAPIMSHAGRSADDISQTDWRHFITGGDKMGETEINDLKQFVDLGRSMGIQMIGVQMPLYGPAVRTLEKDPNYRIVADFRDHVANGYFRQLGITVFDYLSLPPYSDDYRYFLDVIHPGEQLTALVVENLAGDPAVHAVLPHLDVDGIRRELDQQNNIQQHVMLMP
jgi:hypothetical protein